MLSGRAEGGIFVVGCTDPKWEPTGAPRLNDPSAVNEMHKVQGYYRSTDQSLTSKGLEG